MFKKLSRKNTLIIFLWLMAIHSFLVGVLLIAMPLSGFQYFGFDITNKFYACQGGTFHIIMAVCYVMAVKWLDRSDVLIVFSILVKFMATLFLLSYYMLAENILTVLLSGIGDLLMALLLLLFFRRFKITQQKTETS